MKRIFLYVVVVMESVVFSGPLEEAIASISASLQTDPHFLVRSCVNPSTGDFYQVEEDAHFPGYEPITLTRTYISSCQGSRASKWDFYEDLFLQILPVRGSVSYYLLYKEGSAAIFFQEAMEQGQKIKDFYRPVDLGNMKGYCNTSSGQIGARFNHFNHRIRYYAGENTYHFVGADGTQKWYGNTRSKKGMKSLQKVRKPSGNWIFYQYDEHDRVLEIKTTNPARDKCYAKVSFIYQNNPFNAASFTCLSQHGHRSHHIFQLDDEYQEARSFYLDYIIRPFSPTCQYHYKQKMSEFGPRLISTKLMENIPVMDIRYHLRKDRKKKKTTDLLEDRVERLDEPVGENGNMVCTHVFSYDLPQSLHPELAQFGYLGAQGKCSVVDAKKRKTEYYFSSTFQPLVIKRIGLDPLKEDSQIKEVISSEDYVWVEPASGQRLLRSRYLTDGKMVFFGSLYEYDTTGNILKEHQVGNFSGLYKKSLPILDLIYKKNVLDDFEEKCTTTLTYTDDDYRLIRSKEDPNGSSTEYDYLPDTNLIRAIYTKVSEKTVRREMNIYNEDHVVVQKILDDGSSKSSDDLTDVTFRKVTKIQPKTAHPALHFPETIEELIMDPKSQQLLLVTRKGIHYNNNCQVIQEDICDDQNALAYSLFYAYDGKGHLIYETDPLGRVQTKEYNAMGHLIQEKPFASDVITHYEVDTLGRRMSSYQEGEDITYKALYEYNAMSELIKKTDAYGYVTLYQYDDRGFVKAITHNQVNAFDASQSLSTTTSSQNVQGLPVKEIDSLGGVLLKSYNVRGQLTDVQYPDKTQEHFLYDRQGNLIQHVDAKGLTHEYTYDALGRSIRKKTIGSSIKVPFVETWTYDAFKLLSHIDSAGIHTVYGYDEKGRVTRETRSAQDQVIEQLRYGYDSLSRRNRITRLSSDEKMAQIKHLHLDFAGRVLEEREEDTTGKLYSRTQYKYHPSDQIAAIIKDTGDDTSIQRYEYDGLGRISLSIDPYGNTTSYEYEAILHAQSGLFLQRVTTIDPQGRKVIEDYNGKHKLLRKAILNRFGETLHEESYGYDSETNLIQTQVTSHSNGESKTLESVYSYDNMRRLIHKIEYANESSPIKTAYDYQEGLLKRVTESDGSWIAYEYDRLSRLIREFSSDGSISYSFVYDNLGRLIEIIDSAQKNNLKRSYDDLGRIVEETFPSGLALKRYYDSLGRVQSITLPDQSRIKYAYDAYNLMKVERVASKGSLLYEKSYDNYNLLHKAGTEKAPFDLMNITKTYRKDATLHSVASPYFKETATCYDSLGRIEKLDQESVLYQGEISYTFDTLDHVCGEKGIHEHQYSYDSLHRRLQKDLKSYENTEHNLLLSDASYRYQYDPLGRRVEKAENTKISNYHYDALDRLISLETPSLKLLYTYDYFNRKLSKSVFKKKGWGAEELSYREYYLYDEDLEIAAFDENNSMKNLKIQGSQDVIAIEVGHDTYVPLQDVQSNIVALIDRSWGTVSESYRYSIYGEEKIYNYFHQNMNTSKFQNPWRYQSQRIDEESTLVWIHKRWLDPANGMYLSKQSSGEIKDSSSYLPESMKRMSSEETSSKGSFFSEYRDGYDLAAVLNQNFQQWLSREDKRATVRFHDPLLADTKESIPKWAKKLFNVNDIRVSEIPGRQSPDVFFSFNNGMCTTYEDACAAAKSLSQCLRGHEVTLIYDPRHKLFEFYDILVKKFGSKLGAVKTTIDVLLHELKLGKIIVPIGFSKGGLTLKTALTDKRFDPYRSKIYPRTFGSPVPITPNEGTNPINYRSLKDPISYSLFDKNAIHGDYHTDLPTQSLWPEHRFLNETYQEALQRECENILLQFGLK